MPRDQVLLSPQPQLIYLYASKQSQTETGISHRKRCDGRREVRLEMGLLLLEARDYTKFQKRLSQKHQVAKGKIMISGTVTDKLFD